ncbi:unnamed protein product [Absidia cylindrospora]
MPFYETHGHNLPVPRSTTKCKKDGTPAARTTTQMDYKEALMVLMDKDDVTTELVFFNNMANSLCAELKSERPLFINTGWKELPYHIKKTTIAKFENRLGSPPYNMPVNRAQGHWLFNIISQRWGNKNRRQKETPSQESDTEEDDAGHMHVDLIAEIADGDDQFDVRDGLNDDDDSELNDLNDTPSSTTQTAALSPSSSSLPPSSSSGQAKRTAPSPSFSSSAPRSRRRKTPAAPSSSSPSLSPSQPPRSSLRQKTTKTTIQK